MKKFIALALVGFLLFSATSCREKIDAAYEGILVNQYGDDKGQGVALVSGSTWYNPFTEDVFEFATFVQNADYEVFDVTAKDGSIFNVNPRIAYRITKGKAPEIFRKYRKSLEEIQASVLNTYTRDAFRVVFNRYTTDDIISRRDTVETLITNNLKATLEADGFHLEQLTYSMTPPKSIQEAIDLKNKENSKALQAENKVKTAEAEAKSLLVTARAQAEANRLISESLSPELVKLRYIEALPHLKVPIYGQSPVLMQSVK